MRYSCHFCHKSVSSELPDDSVIRATLICPECLELGDPTKLNAALDDIAKKLKEKAS
jgi:hypothetical protein